MSNLAIGFFVAGIIFGIIGLAMVGLARYKNNDMLESIGWDVVILGLTLVGGGFAIAAEIASATQAAVLSILLTAGSILTTIRGQGIKDMAVTRAGLPNQMRNIIMVSDSDGVPSHGVIIFENRADSYIYDTPVSATWLEPPVRYRANDKVIEYWIRTENNAEIVSVEQYIVTEVVDPEHPIFRTITSRFDLEYLDFVKGRYYNGFNWIVVNGNGSNR